MANRILLPREEKLKEQFNGCGLELIAVENVTLGNKNSVYVVNGAILYRIKNTNSYLLYGEPVNYSSILEKLKNTANTPEDLKKLFKENMDINKETEREIDGEAVTEEEKSSNVELVQEQEKSPEQSYNPDDVELLISEGKISKEEAQKALKNANFDVIQALIDLNKK